MRSLMRFVLLTLALRMSLTIAVFAQDAPTQKVDQIFSVYDKPGSPGCSVGVIRVKWKAATRVATAFEKLTVHVDDVS